MMRFRILPAAAVLAALVAGCTVDPTTAPTAAPVSTLDELELDVDKYEPGPPLPAGAVLEQPGEVAPEPVRVDDVEGSLRPDDATPAERIPHIVDRGRIIVGIDQSQNLLSFRDPVSGELRGFEVELAQEIAEDIFGDRDAVDFRFIDSTQRVDALNRGQVDVIIRTTTITEERQRDIEFSTPYFTVETRMLTVVNSGINTYADLADRVVCVATDTTAIQKARLAAPDSPILRTRRWSDCLLALQQRQADAIISDTTILSGIAQQDPYTHIVGGSLGREDYGIGMRKITPDYDNSGLVRQVNSTIERIRNDGTWWDMVERWFGPYLTVPYPPPLNYREEDPADAAEPAH